MDWKTYFETTKGIGILATADKSGNVNAAVYGRPHVEENGTIAFIMQPRLSYANLQINPKAVYLFWENAAGDKGYRLYLEKIHEEDDPETVRSARRSEHKNTTSGREKARLVYFRIEHVRPLIGYGEAKW